MFISTHMVLKEKFGVINVYICKNIGHLVLNAFGVFIPLHFDFIQGKLVNANRKQE